VGIDPSYGFFRLGTEQAGNLPLWRFAIGEQAERIRDALAALNSAASDERDVSMRLDADAHFLLVAIRNGMRFAERVQEFVSDDRLATALATFTAHFLAATDLRDVLTHLDEYVLDQGRLQPEGKSKRKGEVAAGSSSWRVVVDNDVMLVYGPYSVRLLAIAAAAEEVLGLALELWERRLRDNVDVDDSGLEQS
jgi:hypothetical protein